MEKKYVIGRFLVVVVNLLFNYERVFKLIGWVNWRGWLVRNILITFTTKDEKANYATVCPSRWMKTDWDRPCLLGMYWHGWFRFGLTFVLALESDKLYTMQAELEGVVLWSERVQYFTNARTKTWGRTLPAKLNYWGFIEENHEEINAAVVVAKCLHNILLGFPGKKIPIVIPQGDVKMGDRIRLRLPAYDVYTISPNDPWPENLVGVPVIFVSTAWWALDRFAATIPKGSIVVNEVFRPFDADFLSDLSDRECKFFQVMGVRGGAFPIPFPGRDVVPCCGLWLTRSEITEKDMANLGLEVVLKRLN